MEPINQVVSFGGGKHYWRQVGAAIQHFDQYTLWQSVTFVYRQFKPIALWIDCDTEFWMHEFKVGNECVINMGENPLPGKLFQFPLSFTALQNCAINARQRLDTFDVFNQWRQGYTDLDEKAWELYSSVMRKFTDLPSAWNGNSLCLTVAVEKDMAPPSLALIFGRSNLSEAPSDPFNEDTVDATDILP